MKLFVIYIALLMSSFLAYGECQNYDYYIDNQYGSSTHLRTQLEWMRCPVGMNWTPEGCEGEASRFTWQAALVYAADVVFNDKMDWRVPNKNELQSIVNYYCNEPAVNDNVFMDIPLSDYWTSTHTVADHDNVWSVNLAIGTVNTSPKNRELFFLLVR
ncbi:Lcl C-terminal domain-containing protein [Shewanella surugensis]|uniref:DUF1566 domain-containing protein n=1 Tax=Shewanella surugensis TaxID=212020 RepID=A0ABT0LHW1_9GAMM|nr:DUF1566 domain-containing protein [Shewanella surugensis]MCL1127297.1 DUF1566 domain-containing protein [Shewanella surugensis]